jgi:K+-sensing histidine kinase KdpD
MEKAAFLIIGAHSAYYVFNLISFSYLSLYPDIARVITYSAIATVIGAFIRSQRSFENRIAIELRTDSQKELSNIHNKFLNLLSKGLRDQNRRIAQKVRELIHLIPNIEKDTEELLENAASGADELGEYLDGLAEYAEIENHKLKEPNKSNINLFELLTSVSKQCHPSKRNISVEIDGDRDLIVNSDFVYLKSVTYNLISNAIKYSPEGYKVTVKITEKKDFFQVDIIDFGPGIPNGLKDRIFEKFYRIKDDRAFTSKGTGLGLYLTKYFAEIIGCTILVKDNTPNGSVFVLKIPKGVNK